MFRGNDDEQVNELRGGLSIRAISRLTGYDRKRISRYLLSRQQAGLTPRLCRPYRPQTKGKLESGMKYVRRNFLCGLQGREPVNLTDLNAERRRWVANQRFQPNIAPE